jgi:succinate dehydrogenase/fumarate reductase cytochrome b subunit
MRAKSAEVAARRLWMTVVAILVLLTVQGYTGGFIVLFAVFPSAINSTISGFYQALTDAGLLTVYHASEGLVLVLISILIVVLALVYRSNIGVRVSAVIGMTAVISAAVGGILFVLSGFKNEGNSAQMAGSYIGAYASNFLVLYFLKEPAKTP